MSTATQTSPPTRLVELYRREKAIEFARAAVRQAGPTQESVAGALNVTRAAVANWVNRTVQPELRDMMLVLIGAEPWSDRAVMEGLKVVAALNADTETTGRHVGEMILRAAEIRDLVTAPLPKLLKRGHYLWAKRHDWNGEECAAAAAESLERWGSPALSESWGQIELLDVCDVLVNLHHISSPFAAFRQIEAGA